MTDYKKIFKESLDKLKNEGNYRVFADLEKIAGNFPQALNYQENSVSEVTVWCSNDYLGMSQNKLVIESMIEAVNKVGAGSGGTRNISGTNHYHVLLERELCYLHQKESALLFNSGYLANQASLSTLGKKLPDCVFFSDEKNHASMIQGMKNSSARKIIFEHNNLIDLEKKLKASNSKSKIIVFESVYSMDGDFGEVAAIVNLAKKYNVLTYCDEVHAVGLYGEKGGGYCQEIGLDGHVDIIQGTFAKAYGTIGGFITGCKDLIDAVRLNSSGFIFSTSLPPMIAAATIKNVEYLTNSDEERLILKSKVAQLKNLLEKSNIPFVKNDSHIVSIKIGDARKAEFISKLLLEDFGIYIQHINYPTVAKGDERLRVIVTPHHSNEMIFDLIYALNEVFRTVSHF